MPLCAVTFFVLFVSLRLPTGVVALLHNGVLSLMSPEGAADVSNIPCDHRVQQSNRVQVAMSNKTLFRSVAYRDELCSVTYRVELCSGPWPTEMSFVQVRGLQG